MVLKYRKRTLGRVTFLLFGLCRWLQEKVKMEQFEGVRILGNLDSYN